jgi:hypothetical protein
MPFRVSNRTFVADFTSALESSTNLAVNGMIFFVIKIGLLLCNVGAISKVLVKGFYGLPFSFVRIATFALTLENGRALVQLGIKNDESMVLIKV